MTGRLNDRHAHTPQTKNPLREEWNKWRNGNQKNKVKTGSASNRQSTARHPNLWLCEWQTGFLLLRGLALSKHLSRTARCPSNVTASALLSNLSSPFTVWRHHIHSNTQIGSSKGSGTSRGLQMCLGFSLSLSVINNERTKRSVT